LALDLCARTESVITKNVMKTIKPTIYLDARTTLLIEQS
jgi:hypothetical protein